MLYSDFNTTQGLYHTSMAVVPACESIIIINKKVNHYYTTKVHSFHIQYEAVHRNLTPSNSHLLTFARNLCYRLILLFPKYKSIVYSIVKSSFLEVLAKSCGPRSAFRD